MAYALASCSASNLSPTPTLPVPTVISLPVDPTDFPSEATALPDSNQEPTPTQEPNKVHAVNLELITAARNGDIPTVQRLLSQGADINGVDAQGTTAVLAATQNNQVETVRALIQAGADINLRDNRQDNVFLYAGAEGRLEILRLAIDANADTRLTNRFGGTALIPAAERGHVEIVRELLTRTDVDVNHINNLGWTALLEAVILGNGGERHQQVVQLLVDHGANLSIGDKDGITPLEHARVKDYKEIERILVAAIQARDAQLISAAGEGDFETVRHLLAQGADVHALDRSGRTALVAAAYRNHLAIAELLIQAGADVNTQDDTRQSAYLIATSEGYLELLLLTLRNGADVHSLDSYNGTGLIRAAERGHFEIIQELLKTDIKIDHVNRLGWTALLEAIILGSGGERHTEVVRLLVEAGADVNLPDGNGVTPLAHARRLGHVQIAGILERAGAD